MTRNNPTIDHAEERRFSAVLGIHVEERRFSAASRIKEIRASAPVAPPGLKAKARGDETRP